MRLIVIGEVVPQSDSTLKGSAWFRFPIPEARQAIYAVLQSKYQPEAPGDYNGEDAAETSLFQSGAFYEERVGDDVRFVPAAGLQVMEAQIAGFYALSAANFIKKEEGRWSYYRSAFDGQTWDVRSA